MKNVIITILTILVLGMGGYLVYDKVIQKGDTVPGNEEIKEETNSSEQKNEEYTLMDINSELIQFLYNSSKGVSIYDDVIYTTKYLSSTNRSYEDKLCLIMNQVKENTGAYSEVKIKELYEKVNGVSSYNRLERVSCPCATFDFNTQNSEFYIVEDGCGSTAVYQENINEVRKYDNKIEIITTYYYNGYVSNTGLNDWKVCTDITCNTVLVESNEALEIDVFENYKDKLNKLTYTYNLAENGDYYYYSTEINKQ